MPAMRNFYFYKYKGWNILFVSSLNILFSNINTEMNIIVCDRRTNNKIVDYWNNNTIYESIPSSIYFKQINFILKKKVKLRKIIYSDKTVFEIF